jgi:hypothetical protein
VHKVEGSKIAAEEDDTQESSVCCDSTKGMDNGLYISSSSGSGGGR